MALTIDSLEIKIQDNARNSVGGIDALANSLGNLKSAIGDTGGLIANLSQLAQALKALSTSGKAFANGIKVLNEATASLNSARLAEFSVQMQGIANGLSQLQSVGKSNIGSIVNALKKIPEITASLDSATITAFSSALKNVNTAVAPLAANMEKITAGFKTLKSPMQTTISQLNKYAAASNKAAKSQKGFLSRLIGTIGKFATFYYSINRVTDVLSDLFDESNEYIESLNLFKVAMGDAADEAQRYAERVGEVMGIDPAEWMTNQGIFQRMAAGFGISADQAGIMSTNLTQLAYDMSSFFNVDVQTAMDKLSSGMSGQIKGLKEWGYNLSVAALQETAYALGIEQSVRTMTEAQKAQLRYITLIMKSNGVMGDMAKTLVTPANAMRVLSAQLTQLKRALGNIVSVLVTKFIPYFQAFVKLMAEAARALATLMGFEVPELDTGNLDMGSDVIDGIGDSADDSVDSLNELKKQLAGFDEINILKDETDNKTPIYDLGIELPEYDFIGNAFSEYTEIVEKFKEVISDLKDVFEQIDFSPIAEGIGKLFTTLGEQLKNIDFGQYFVDIFATLLDTIVDILSLVLEVVNPLVEALNLDKGATAGFELLIQIFETIGNIIEAITPAISAIIEALSPIFEWIGGTATEGVSFLTEVFKGLGEMFERLKPTLTSIGKTLGKIIKLAWKFIEPLLTIIKDGIFGVLGELIESLFSGFENGTLSIDTVLGSFVEGLEDLFEALSPIADLVGTVLSDAFGWIASIFSWLGETLIPLVTDTLSELFTEVLSPLANLITDILKPVFEVLAAILTPLWENVIVPIVDAIGGALGDAIRSVFDVIQNIIIPVLNAVISLLTFLWDNILQPIVDFLVDILKPIFSETFGGIGEIIEGLKTSLGGITTFINGVFSGDWSKAWEGIKDIFKGIWDSLVGVVKTPLNALIGLFEGLANKIIDAWNWIKDGINSVSFDMPDWLGGGHFGFDLEMSGHISIPRLATGGFPAMGQMFIARERGPELVGNIGNKNAVVNNAQIIQGIASGVYSAMMAAKEDGDNGSGGTAKIIVQIDGREVGEASVRYINGQIVQTGASPIYS